MNDILIVSPDTVFARMLFLELKKGDGVNIKVISGKLDLREIMLSASKADIVVYDADYNDGDIALVRQMRVPCIVFSKKGINNLPENVLEFFERPFVVSHLVSSVYSYLTKSYDVPQEKEVQTEREQLSIDRFSKQAIFDGKRISLSPREYALLSLLYKNRGHVVLRKDVLDAIWGKDYDEKNNADNVYISYLRKKLDDAFGVKMIYTVRGKGYMLK